MPGKKRAKKPSAPALKERLKKVAAGRWIGEPHDKATELPGQLKPALAVSSAPKTARPSWRPVGGGAWRWVQPAPAWALAVVDD